MTQHKTMIFGLNRFFPVIIIVNYLIGINTLFENPIYPGLKTAKRTSDFNVFPTATPDTICPGMASQLSANPIGGTPPISYIWWPETGLDDPTSPTPIATPTSTITYTVTATDSSMQTATNSVEVFVKDPPQAPGPISGPNIACIDSTETYSIAEVYGSTSYSWTVPQGDTIISGQNTTQVEIKWSGSQGPVSVIAGNECGNSNPSVLPVTLDQAPEITGNIEGPGSACAHENIDFFVMESPGATGYFWNVPEDAQINEGQGTISINVTWGDTPGNILVTAGNFCGQGEPQSKSILFENLPGPAGTITGEDSVCLNHANYIYSILPVPNTITYEWNLPDGAEITDGKETNTITVFFTPDATSGTISVVGENRCGKGDESVKEITVNQCAGIYEDQTQDLIRPYPNPANTVITIKIPGSCEGCELMITDIDGRVQIIEELSILPVSFAKRINISKFAPGVYFVHMVGNNKFLTGKLIVL